MVTTILTIFNLGITSSFQGLFPDTIRVSSRHHAAAIRHYRRALRATHVSNSSSSTRSTQLRSEYGFRFSVRPLDTRPNPNAVRLALPSNVNRASVARLLAGNNFVSHRREGLVLTDPYGVTWTLA